MKCEECERKYEKEREQEYKKQDKYNQILFIIIVGGVMFILLFSILITPCIKVGEISKIEELSDHGSCIVTVKGIQYTVSNCIDAKIGDILYNKEYGGNPYYRITTKENYERNYGM